MSAVLAMVAGRNENFDLLADQFVSAVAKELLGLGIDLQDGAGLVHRNDGVGNGLEQTVREQDFS
jgi:hypothetical protein